jgi:hypothetical protein
LDQLLHAVPPEMTLDPPFGLAFINGYKYLLLAIKGGSRRLKGDALLKVLAASRGQLQKNPKLLDAAVKTLYAESLVVTDEVVEAVRTLRVKQWVYLRDTRTHSIFLDPAAEVALGVLGLTQRVRDITGASGVVVETGIVRYRGRFVCDGLATPIAMLGRNYRASFNESFRALKAQGRYHVTAEERQVQERNCG